MSEFFPPRIRRLFPTAAFAAAAVFLYHPVLRPSVLLFGNDTIFHDYPMLWFGWTRLKGGALVSWLPYLYSGIPFIGSFAFCPFYPLSWLFLILPFPFAFNFQYPLHSVLAGAFVYRFLRACRLSRFPAAFGGLGFQLSGHFATLCYPGHLQKIQAIVWIPLALAFLHKGLFTRKRANFLFSGAAMAMPLLTSHPQIYYYGAGALFLYLLWCIANRKIRPLAVPLKRILPLFAVVIFFSLALSAAQVLPAYETSTYSVRAGGMSFEKAVKSSYPPSELWELVLPRFTGDNIRGGYGHYMGSWGERLVSDYLGVTFVILGLLGCIISRRMNKFFFTALFLLTVLVACGGYSPLYRLMYEVIPGMSYFRSPATAMFLLSLSASILAAFGLEAVLEKTVKQKPSSQESQSVEGAGKKTALTPFFRNILLVGLLLFLLTLFLHTYYLRVYGKWMEHQEQGGEAALFYQKATLLVNSLRRSAFFGAMGLAALSFLLFARFLFRNHKIPLLGFGLAQAAFLIIAGIDPALNDRAFIQPEPVQPYHRHLFHTWPDTVLKDEKPPVKLLERGNELSNRHMMSGIGAPLGYHPIEIQPYIQAWNAVQDNSHTAAKLTACRFLLTPEKVKLHNSLVFIEENTKMNKTLYRWRDPLPYGWAPERIESVPERDQLLKLMSREDFDPYKTSYILSGERLFQERKYPASEYHVRVRDYTPGRVTVATDLPEDSHVVFGDTWMPGWKASLEDRTPLRFYVANNAFRCLKIPPGKHTVTMQYQPDSLSYGIIITLISLALWIGLVIYLPQLAMRQATKNTNEPLKEGKEE